MAEMAGGAFLTVVFDKLFEKLASVAEGAFSAITKNSVASDLKKLERKLKKVKLLLDDAEDKQLVDKNVKEWLDHLRHVVFMADDLVEEINNPQTDQRSKRTLAGAFKSVYHSLAKNVQDDIDLILMDLDDLLDQARDLHLQYVSGGDAQSSRSSPAIIAPLREEHHVFGREAEKEKILEMLFSEEDKIGVLPIVGMGGLGKTTLAQLVYGDKRVKEHGFILKAWVTVSTKFDFYRIIKELLKEVSVCTSDVNDPYKLQELMKEAVSGKKFLFVLDDVWDESYSNWDLLMSNFRVGDSRSRVIVTTRSGDVGKIVKTGPVHELKEVHKDDCWSIFVHHAFNGDLNADPKLQDIGREIVAKCKGLPLAVKSIGGLLRCERNPQNWENILKSKVWSTNQKGNEVLPSLWLSYRYLPSSLNQCFAYCSLFPQDYQFHKQRLVLLWMAEGFLHEKDKSMEEVGEQYLDDLVSRSLFQRSYKPNFLGNLHEEEEVFVMHDLVHDLAAFVYGQFCFRKGNDLKNLTTRTRHFLNSDESSEMDIDLLTALSTAKHLRTFIRQNSDDLFGRSLSISEKFSVKEMATKMRCLRVLSLSLRSSVLHHSLGDLKMLRFLDLSENEIEELPDSICSLFHLQTLILRNCKELTRLPTEMRKLVKLRHLDTSDTYLEKMPPNMGNLKELRILTDFVLGDNRCSSLKELGELIHLSGKLCICKLQNVRNLEDVQNANILRDKAEMKELSLQWGWNSDTRAAVDVLEALRPHTNLESLRVYDYPGSSFPKWVGETSFSKMVYVRLWGTYCCRFLPPLGQLPSLRELLIEWFEGVEKIGNEFLYGNDSSSITPFPSLQKLEFKCMYNWEEWSFVGSESGCFPRLQSLLIGECPKLKSITEDDMQSTKLKELEIEDCDLLERRYQKYKGDGWPYISHIPHTWISGYTTYKLEEEERRRGENSASQNV